MPRRSIDYSKTVIYKIVCNDLNVKYIYVGHTTDFTKRKNQHKTVCNNEKRHEYNLKIYITIRNNGNWDNWSMIEIEKYPCKDSNEATAQERYWYEQLSANLNIHNPNRTSNERNELNKDYITERKKQWYEKNKDVIANNKKEKYENNKESHKKKCKEYYELNKDDITEYKKQWYEKNKEVIAKKIKEKYENNKEDIAKRQNKKCICECGAEYTYTNKIRHQKSKKHQDYLNKII